MNAGAITKRKLSDQVVERLEADIRDGVYAVGSHLPSERELMALYAVGRPSVREALFLLQRMGLVRIASGERALVTRPAPEHLLSELSGVARYLLETPEGVDHFEQARLFLEVGLVRYAADHATGAQIEGLRDALERNCAAIGQGRPFRTTDVAFHRMLAEIPGNPIFTALHDAVVDWLIVQRPPVPDPEVNNKDSHTGHAAIFQAIADRDPAAAARAMELHLGNARKRYSTPAE